MVIFGAIAMTVLVAAGFTLLASTSWAQHDPSDADTYGFLAVMGAGTPLLWSTLNLALLATRRQTGGQYVAGLKLARDDGGRSTPLDALAWWVCLNPLLFSWPMVVVAGLPLAAIFALVLSRWTVFLFTLVLVLCVAAPVIALISALVDAQNRTLHDRIAGTLVVPAS